MPGSVRLRPVQEGDPAPFFRQQLGPAANYMVAFTDEDPANRDAFNAHWVKILADVQVIVQTILFDEMVAGRIESFERIGQAEVSYTG